MQGALEDAGPGAERPQLRKADGEPALPWGQRLGEAGTVENRDRTKSREESGFLQTQEGVVKEEKQWKVKRPDGEERSTGMYQNKSEREELSKELDIGPVAEEGRMEGW